MHTFFFYLLLIISIPIFAFAEAGNSDICAKYISDDIELNKDAESSASIPYGSGLLWKVESKEGKTSHLFGTMHSQDRLVTLIPPQVRLALVQSQTLVMEVVLDEEANQIFSESMYISDGKKLNDLLDADIYQRLQTRIIDYGIDENNVPQLKPWAAFSILGKPRPVRAPTLDMVLMQMAASTNKLIVGLESMRELVATLESISMDDQIEILNDTVCNHDEIIGKTRDLVQLYMARDLAGMVAFNEQPHHDETIFNRFMQKILYDRNSRMIDRMEKYVQGGGAFIAVGASHLPDEKGLLKLLENKGYKINKVY